MAVNKICLTDIHALQDECFARNALDLYQESAGKSAVYPGKGTPMGIMYLALKLNGEAGELAEHVGKAMRDDGYGQSTSVVPSPNSYVELLADRRAKIVKELGDILWYVARLAAELNLHLSDVALTNLDKLFQRTENGTLQGSGDDR